MSSITQPINLTRHAVLFGTPQLLAAGDILSLKFNDDGTLWSVEDGGVVREWSPESGQTLAVFSLSDLETLWCFGPHARLLASASDDLSIWDPKTGNLLVAIAQETWVTALAYHPKKAMVATGHDDGTVRCWDIKSKEVVKAFPYHTAQVSAVAFSADGRKLAIGAEDKLISLWRMEDGKQLGVLEGHKDRIPAIRWHPGGDVLASVGWDTTARLWDTNTFEPIILLNYHDTQVLALEFSADGALLATSDSAHMIHIWDFFEKKILRSMKEGPSDYQHLAFNPAGNLLASAGNNIIRIWDPIQGKSLSQTDADSSSQVSLSISDDGTRIATNDGDGPKIWNTHERTMAVKLTADVPVHAVAFAPGNKFVAGGTDTHLCLWDALSGELKTKLDGPKEPITAIAFTHDGKFVAAAGNKGAAVWIWRLEDGQPVLLIPEALNGGFVEKLQFHPHERLLGVAGINVDGSEDSSGAAVLWDIQDRSEVATFPGGCRDLAFDPSGDYLATASVDESVCIWDVKANKLLTELLGHSDAVHAVAYSPDGKWLASGGDDLTIRLWNTGDWSEQVIGEVDTPVKRLAFSPDGRQLHAGGGNGITYRFELAALLGE